ncbi:MAG: hypothetical protein U1A23_01245 [Candidatus Sungbacteria bacterium]|nr:hypothetical protein [Candidatus Sungbacteria bacterium]
MHRRTAWRIAIIVAGLSGPLISLFAGPTYAAETFSPLVSPSVSPKQKTPQVIDLGRCSLPS